MHSNAYVRLHCITIHYLRRGDECQPPVLPICPTGRGPPLGFGFFIASTFLDRFFTKLSPLTFGVWVLSWSNPTGRCPRWASDASIFFCTCNCLGPTVHPHRTLPPVELRMLYWLQSLSSSTRHCRPLSFGRFIGFRVWILPPDIAARWASDSSLVIASICLDRFFTKLSPLIFGVSSSEMPSI